MIKYNSSMGSQDVIFNTLAFSNDDEELGVGCSDGSIRIYDVER